MSLIQTIQILLPLILSCIIYCFDQFNINDKKMLFYYMNLHFAVVDLSGRTSWNHVALAMIINTTISHAFSAHHLGLVNCCRIHTTPEWWAIIWIHIFHHYALIYGRCSTVSLCNWNMLFIVCFEYIERLHGPERDVLMQTDSWLCYLYLFGITCSPHKLFKTI